MKLDKIVVARFERRSVKPRVFRSRVKNRTDTLREQKLSSPPIGPPGRQHLLPVASFVLGSPVAVVTTHSKEIHSASSQPDTSDHLPDTRNPRGCTAARPEGKTQRQVQAITCSCRKIACSMRPISMYLVRFMVKFFWHNGCSTLLQRT